MSDQHVIEYESSISINVTKEIFEESVAVTNDVILIFADNSRLSQRQMQIKTTTDKTFILAQYSDKMFPIIRTKSNEVLTTLSTIDVVRTTFRKILYQSDNFRISMNKDEAEYGVRYLFCGEVEYTENTTYDNIVKLEEMLMSHMKNYHSFIKFEPLTLQDLFMCTAPKIQNFAIANLNEPFFWAYKWNGVKAKMIYCNKTLSFWPDSQDVQIEEIELPLNIDYMCLQVEIMDDRIVIVELIASSYDGNIFTTEPRTNLKFLSRIQNELKNKEIRINDRKLMVQRYYSNPLPPSYDQSLHDGFIISQNDLLIKWKAPTIDVKWTQLPDKKFYFVVDTKHIIQGIKIPPAFEEPKLNAIYEIDAMKMILRERSDRIAPSTMDEYMMYEDMVAKLQKKCSSLK